MKTSWKKWHSGYANAPYIIYDGDRSPSLDSSGQLCMNGSTLIAEVPCDESPLHEQMVAYARAIKAVPEMQEALRVFVNYMEHAGEKSISIKSLAYPLHLAQAAIQKAESGQ